MSVIRRTAFVGLGLLLLSGCGSDELGLVDVEGTVTLDGEPLPNATVAFRPKGAGTTKYTSTSYAGTDEDGYYYLRYSISKDGAIPGDYLVAISTYAEVDEDEGIEESPETIPARYNSDSELTATVESGGGPYDFALTSDGEVVQPDVDR